MFYFIQFFLYVLFYPVFFFKKTILSQIESLKLKKISEGMASIDKGYIYTVFINGGRAERPGFECMKTRLGRL